MSYQSIMFNIRASRSDKQRDAAIPLPEGVTECRNVSYGCHGRWNLLDVYYPTGTTEALPTIVSIHGGGYVYGSKEIYRRYMQRVKDCSKRYKYVILEQIIEEPAPSFYLDEETFRGIVYRTLRAQ